MLTVNLNGIEYPLATNLMVAYKLQNCNNHTPYTQLFQSIGDMTLEKQLEILFVAFQVANPTEKNFSQQVFQTLLMNDAEFSVTKMMKLIEGIVKGILGSDDSESTSNGATQEGNA